MRKALSVLRLWAVAGAAILLSIAWAIPSAYAAGQIKHIRIEGAQRIEELAEMIGGQRVSETTRSQARELLEAASSAQTITTFAAGDRTPRRKVHR